MSFYIPPGMMDHYEGLREHAERRNMSFSDVMCEAMKQMYFQQSLGLSVTPGAYVAVSRREFEYLNLVELGGGRQLLCLSEDAARPLPGKDGDSGDWQRVYDYTVRPRILEDGTVTEDTEKLSDVYVAMALSHGKMIGEKRMEGVRHDLAGNAAAGDESGETAGETERRGMSRTHMLESAFGGAGTHGITRKEEEG